MRYFELDLRESNLIVVTLFVQEVIQSVVKLSLKT